MRKLIESVLLVLLFCALSWDTIVYANLFKYGEPIIAMENCNKTIQLRQPYGRVRLLKANHHGYERDKTCKFKIRSMNGTSLLLAIRSLHIRRYLGHCLNDYVRFYSNGRHSKHFCGFGSRIETNIADDAGTIEVEFKSHRNVAVPNNRSGFELILTSYHTGSCTRNERSCYVERRCVPKEVMCDNVHNCGDFSDEYCYLAPALITAIVFSAVITIGFLLACVCCCSDAVRSTYRRKRRNRQRQPVPQQPVREEPPVEIPMQALDPTKIIITPPPYPGFGPDKSDGPPGYYENQGFVMPPIYNDPSTTAGPTPSVSQVVSNTSVVTATDPPIYEEISTMPEASGATSLSQIALNSPRINNPAPSSDRQSNLTPVSIHGQPSRPTT